MAGQVLGCKECLVACAWTISAYAMRSWSCVAATSATWPAEDSTIARDSRGRAPCQVVIPRKSDGHWRYAYPTWPLFDARPPKYVESLMGIGMLNERLPQHGAAIPEGDASICLDS
eukprot:TRINITY_DN1295_c0_g1_i1.p2 TRINITY_DN1295_c0_g1~~TRINITY_DN1295_c0_g1_i1.p2  ORF type:complete len:116 (-),score=7.08 TRINITY_DN1295_c0_g1_i1:399-746(-)